MDEDERVEFLTEAILQDNTVIDRKTPRVSRRTLPRPRPLPCDRRLAKRVRHRRHRHLRDLVAEEPSTRSRCCSSLTRRRRRPARPLRHRRGPAPRNRVGAQRRAPHHGHAVRERGLRDGARRPQRRPGNHAGLLRLQQGKRLPRGQLGLYNNQRAWRTSPTTTTWRCACSTAAAAPSPAAAAR